MKITDWAPAEYTDQEERVEKNNFHRNPQRQTSEVNHLCYTSLRSRLSQSTRSAHAEYCLSGVIAELSQSTKEARVCTGG